MKKLFKTFCIVCCALLLLAVLVACDKPTPDTPPTPPAADNIEYDLSEYEIIRASTAPVIVSDAATCIKNKVSAITDRQLMVYSDALTEDKGGKEILIGNTSRPESAEAFEKLTNDESFIITVINDRIVINAKDDLVLVSAIDYFRRNCFNEVNGSKIALQKDLCYISDPVPTVDFIKDGKSDYKIVYLNGLDHSTTDATDKFDIEVKFCIDLNKSLTTATSLSFDITNDGEDRNYEILVGNTSRKESVEFRNSLDYDEYGYYVTGNKIVVSGTNDETTLLAMDVFMRTVNSLYKDSSLSLRDGMRVTFKTGTWNLKIPEVEVGTFLGTLDSANGSLTIAHGDTTPEDFEAYCKKLEEYGYELWQRNDIEDNLHATYTGKFGMVHTYYTANEKILRIITYKPNSYNLPEHTERESYNVITNCTVTQYGLDRVGGSAGMGYVITLEDGSFIVIDGGLQNDRGNMQIEFYNLLKHLNKRPDGKIVIAAWYLTHEHGDHYQMFCDFMQDYGKQVTIEELWCNPTSKQYTYNSDSSTRMIEANYSKFKSWVNGDFKWITMHTGMKFYVRNLEIEVLYTEEDLFPQVCRSFNNTDLILKMNSRGCTMLWLGDLLEAGANTLAANYDGYLKSDILQVAHHGKSVALPVYQQVKPTVALWSCTTSMMNSQTTSSKYSQYFATNVFLRDNVPQHVTSDNTYTITIPYKLGDNIVAWKK